MQTPILAKVQNSGEIPRGNLTLISRQNQICIRFERAKIKYFLAEVQISVEIPRDNLTLTFRQNQIRIRFERAKNRIFSGW